MSEKYLLKVENLTCERNYVKIFNKLSFKLYPGDIILIEAEIMALEKLHFYYVLQMS